jgi:hypothetical protein
MIAKGAALLLTKYHVLQKPFYIVTILIDDIQVLLIGIGFESVFPPLSLLVRMYVPVIEKAHHFEILGS